MTFFSLLSKLFLSKEEIHLGEQSQALDQYKAISLKRILYRFIFVFVIFVSDSFSFTVSLLLLVYKFKDLNMDAGKYMGQCDISKYF